MPLAPTSDWRQALTGNKWLLWDTSAVIRIIEYGAEKVFDELANLKVVNCYIHPVLLELLATKNDSDRLKRSALLARHLVTELPFNSGELDLAKRLQTAMAGACQSSPVDLYCGAVGMKYGNNMLILTENVKDFPAPFFSRNGYVTLEKDNGVSSLSLLSANLSKI